MHIILKIKRKITKQNHDQWSEVSSQLISKNQLIGLELAQSNESQSELIVIYKNNYKKILIITQHKQLI